MQHFGQDASESVDELMILIMSTPSTLEDSEAAVQMLRGYSEIIQKIGQLAWDSGLEGLQSVCSLVETNLMLLQSESRVLTAEEGALLEGWPMLLFGYMSNQADFESSSALLQSLSKIWPMPLDTDSAAAELARLMEKTSAPTANSNSFPDDLRNKGTQQVDREMLAILASELVQMDEQFSLEAAATHEDRLSAISNYCDFLQRLKSTTDSIGLAALAALFDQLGQRIVQLPAGLSAKQQILLHQIPAILATYLAAPEDEETGAALVAVLADSAWITPLAQDEILLWQEALANVEITDNSSSTPERQTRAELKDVSLELPDDVNTELLDGLLQELPVQVAAFTGAIARIASGQGSIKDEERAMRAAHTLKGAANTVGVSGIANFTHHLEDILVALIEAGKLPSRALSAVLINAGDCLEAMCEFLLSIGPAPEQSLGVFQEILDCANRIDHEGVDAESVEIEATSWPVHAERNAAQEASDIKSGIASHTVEQSLRVPAPVVDDLLRLAGETLISNSLIQERLTQSISQAAAMRKQHQLFQQLVSELEELVDIRGITSLQNGTIHQGEKIDALEFEHYSELHSISRRLIEAATDANEMTRTAESQLSTLDSLLEDQRRLQMANQHAVMRTRMVAVSSIVSRLQRGVRQTGRLLDKPVELAIQGENTSIDSQVLNDLVDPLMHILRNAVDHGIEPIVDREEAGKSPQGRIELTFAHEGNSIVVRCKDDGAGLDYAAIRRIAERKGMLRPEQEHTEDELARLILVPGFSTREETSQVSGRGVGMDVVYSRVKEMKGMLALNSQSGFGLTVELRIPAMLLATHTLIVRQRGQRLAISSRGIEDIRYATREQITEISQRQFYREGEKMYSLDKLEDLLSMRNDRRADDKHGYPILLTRRDDGTVSAVLVQELLDSREVVMKNLGRYVPRTQGVIGAVILGDGDVAPVIDLVELLSVPTQRSVTRQNEESLPILEQHTGNKLPCALVVDDSLSSRRSMSQVLKDAGYDVRTANDGIEAVNILHKFAPDIILTDMEMPRMNGLELTANVRHAEHTKHIPVIMITSRSTEKHRQMSTSAGVNEHLVKPFNDEALLQHVYRLTGQ